MGKTHSAPPIKIQTDLSKSLPRINEYPISKETLQGIKPTTENYKAQVLIISFTSHCNTPILLVRKQRLRVEVCPRPLSNKHIVILQHPVVSNPHILLTSIPTGSKFFTVTDLCRASFSFNWWSRSIPSCLLLGRKTIYLDSNSSRFYWESLFLANPEDWSGQYKVP